MSPNYQHLTRDHRCQIYSLLQSGKSQKYISEHLKRSPSTISREIARNQGQRGYRIKQAQSLSESRRSKASQRDKVWCDELAFIVETKLVDFQWSPEQISGWLRLHSDFKISTERIYQHVWQDKQNGGTLYTHLRHGGKKYYKRSGNNGGRGSIVGRVDISERPAVVDDKERFGDLELDTIIGKNHQGAMVSIVDRASKFLWLRVLPNRKSDVVCKAIVDMLKDIKVHTLTFDNGKEFAQHLDIAQQLDATTYFATPYHSWERGLNEHTNGLVRQYFPKSTSFANITQYQVDRVQTLLNERPRKCLNFQSPKDALTAKTLLH